MAIEHVTEDLGARARQLIQETIGQYDAVRGFGSMSCSVYDTAWVSMVTKTVRENGDEKEVWLFPESFIYLLETQFADGSWDGAGAASQADSILNTGASLLSLLQHLNKPLQMRESCSKDTLESRIGVATRALQARLQDWDVQGCNSVGFEVIVPSLLGLLENTGYKFDFKGKDDLMAINAKKLARFKPEYLYSWTRMTAIHSLEAFVGQIDFDKVSHHCLHGAMMGSPSSTAAYLIYASNWDNTAEDYLRHVVSLSRGGGAPSAYPSTYFEFTWILSTLLRAGFSTTDLSCPELREMTGILETAFEEEGGTIGFAPGVGEDVDDTAKGIMSLAMLYPEEGNRAGTMIDHFEATSHFRTYASERDRSLSANCNVLLGLLHQPDASEYALQILKTARFVCGYWWGTHGTPRDKWNISPLYSSMLLVQAFSDLLAFADKGFLQLDDDFHSRVAIALVQCCLRTAFTQSGNGSWSDSIEQTSYGVAILSEALQLSCFGELHEQLEEALSSAVGFLESSETSPDYIWVEKVIYSSPMLTEAYKLAALKLARSSSAASHTISIPAMLMPAKAKLQYIGLFRQLPLLRGVPEWHLQACLVESSLFSIMCRSRRLEVFERKDMAEDKYFDMIPFIWTVCNNYTKAFTSTAYLYEMIVVSFLNFQADEFMEAVAGTHFKDNIPGLRRLVDDVCAVEQQQTIPTTAVDGLDEVAVPLSRFVQRLLQHPSVTGSSAWDQRRLTQELRIYLQAHITQTEDNTQLYGKQLGSNRSAHAAGSLDETFATWVHTTSADHTSCPYAFAFVSCFLSSSPAYGGGAAKGNAPECFPTASQKYLAARWCRHLAVMCRMYNDLGSVARDVAEGNLNSIDFPEFASNTSVLQLSGEFGPSVDTDMARKKDELFKLAEFERVCLGEAQKHLEQEMLSLRASKTASEARLAVWKVFRDVTDLHGQIYVVRDIASRIKATSNGNYSRRGPLATAKLSRMSQ